MGLVRCRHCKKVVPKCPLCKKSWAIPTSTYRGVSRVNSQSKPWRAMIHAPEGLLYLGTYATEEGAARAYNAKAKELFGDEAKLNEIRVEATDGPVKVVGRINEETGVLTVEQIKQILGARTASKE